MDYDDMFRRLRGGETVKVGCLNWWKDGDSLCRQFTDGDEEPTEDGFPDTIEELREFMEYVNGE